GAKYSTCNGYVTGKLVILDLGRRIVMSWRTTDFPRDAADSRVEVHFETLGPSTRILILHTDIPEGQSEKYKALWNEKYIAPMRSYFSKFLPDPRNPPPRRIPPPPPESDEDEDEDEVPVKGKGKLGAKAAVPAAKSSGPGVHKADGKPAKTLAAAKPSAPAKPAPAKAAPAAKPAAPVKGKPAPKAAAAPAKKPAPVAAKKPAAPAKKPTPAKKPAAAAKKPAAKKPAPKPAKGKKKR
ncbi:MAG: hypothetical protein QOI41_5571, partial [Myxococcales bacterium]|nr:hypothetical protein [Myxococcales bacterium]